MVHAEAVVTLLRLHSRNVQLHVVIALCRQRLIIARRDYGRPRERVSSRLFLVVVVGYLDVGVEQERGDHRPPLPGVARQGHVVVLEGDLNLAAEDDLAPEVCGDRVVEEVVAEAAAFQVDRLEGWGAGHHGPQVGFGSVGQRVESQLQILEAPEGTGFRGLGQVLCARRGNAVQLEVQPVEVGQVGETTDEAEDAVVSNVASAIE